MAKTSGLGDNLLVDGYNLSGDTQDIKTIRGGLAPIDVTGIDKSAYERIGGIRDGQINWTAHFNPAAGATAHAQLSGLPLTDRQVTYLRGTTLGNAAASCIGKQLNYDLSRGTDGKINFDVNVQANAYGLEWGYQLTPGLRADTTATTGTTVDRQSFDLSPSGTSSAFGWQAYLHVTAFSGTSVTATIEDSADSLSWATLSGGAFTAATAIGTQRLASASLTATVRRYVRVTTTGTFTVATFAVNFIPNTAVSVSF